MKNTVIDFWKMIWEYQCRTIVVVNQVCGKGRQSICWYMYMVMVDIPTHFVQEAESCHALLPGSTGECAVYGKVSVKLVSQQSSTDYIIQQLEVFEDKPHPQGSTPSSHPVTLFHYLRWPKHGIPRVTFALLQLIENVNKSQMSSGNKPITVMCK